MTGAFKKSDTVFVYATKNLMTFTGQLTRSVIDRHDSPGCKLINRGARNGNSRAKNTRKFEVSVEIRPYHVRLNRA